MQRMKEGKCDEMVRYAQVYRFARVAQNTLLWWSKWMEVLLKWDEEWRRGRSRRNRVSLRYASVWNDSMRGMLRRISVTQYRFGSVVRSNMKANSRLGDSSSLIRWQVIGSIREVSEEVDSGKNEVFFSIKVNQMKSKVASKPRNERMTDNHVITLLHYWR